jgi:hypothetical protein
LCVVGIGTGRNAILTSNKLAALHSAVISACAGDDGTNDGIITDPRNCHFDPAAVQCPPGDNVSCLTPAQVGVVRNIYQGVVDPEGRHLYPGGLPYGPELSWAGFVIPITPAGGGTVSSQAAADTNLSAFRRHGGKLIIWQGWADQAIPTFGTVDYYDALVHRMGGLHSTQQFARMFLFPTVAHCGGGYANSTLDLVYPIVQWVEGAGAPAEVDATDTISATTLTRPVYPYPLVPQYNGSGPVAQASSFHAVVSPHAHDYSDWIGDYLFHQPVGGSGPDPRSRH